jgi:hypothetical protein
MTTIKQRLQLARNTQPGDVWLLRGTGEPVRVLWASADASACGIESEHGLTSMLTHNRLATDYEQLLPG